MANKTEHVSINLNLSLTRAVVSSSGGFENMEVACAILRGKKLTYDKKKITIITKSPDMFYAMYLM